MIYNRFAGWRRWLFLALVLLLLAIEAGLRWGAGFGDPPLVTLDPDIEYQLVPSQSYRRFGADISINRYGMRGPDHEPKAGPNDRRILLIGDSVIYGNHFLDQTETIAMRLTSLLAGSPSMAGCQPLAMPMAASSWGPVNQAAFLQRTGSLDAVAAVLMVSGHDLYDTPSFSENTVPYRQAAPLTATGDFLRAILERVQLRMNAPSSGSPEEQSDRTLVALDKIVTFLNEDGIDPILVYHATETERAQRASFAEHAVFRQWAADRKISFVNLMDDLAMEEGYRDDIHPNAKGSSLIADALATSLLPRIANCD